MKEKLKNLWLNYKMIVYTILVILLVIVIPNLIWGGSLVEIGIDALPPLGQDIFNYAIIGIGGVAFIYILIKTIIAITNLFKDFFGKK